MKIQAKHVCILALLVLLVSIGRSASMSSKSLLGVSPEDEKYYKVSADIIRCRDGSRTFSKSQFNDDFCDCLDGSDEPGTSACPNGNFYCQNAGHVPVSLNSSRVNDGICDCCDGSDEYDGKLKCPNTCWEAGKVARDKLKKKIAIYQEGVALRKQEVEQAKVAAAKDELELSNLKSEERVIKALVQKLKAHKEEIEKAEEKERLREEMEKREVVEANLEKNKALEEAESQKGKPIESTDDEKIGLLEDSPSDQLQDHDNPASGSSDNFGDEGSLSNGLELENRDSTTDEKDAHLNSESMSREELGRLVASRWTGENAGQQTEEVYAAKEHENHEEIPNDAHDDEYEAYDSESEGDSQKDDDELEDTPEDSEDDQDDLSSYKVESDNEDLSDLTATPKPSWLKKIQETVWNVLETVNLFKTPVNISEAAHVRKEYEDSSAKLSKIQSKISSLEKKLKHDFGPDKEFYSFFDKCFEAKQNKYVYRICPFKQASQVEGHSTTRLGSWEKFGDFYRIMQFSNGDKCWNGPDRSLKVKLRCGLTNEVTDVDEPSRCEYVALLSTPALCLEEKLQELRVKLEMMNKEQPQGHDEL